MTRWRASLGLLCAVMGALPPSAPRAAAPAAVHGARGMVVAPEPLAAEVGLAVLRSGGNAVDAGVAVALALAVTYPLAGNLGGGGFLLYRSPSGEHAALDFRETAPRALRPALFLDEDGRPLPDLSLHSGLAVGVPGSVAGLAEAHRRWGSRPWAAVVAPAIRLAADGFEVSEWLARSLERSAPLLARHPATRSIFTHDGNPLHAGERLVQRELAASLRRIAADGPAGFYRGPVAAALVATVREAGGVLDLEDLTDYRAVLREPLERRYRGWRVVTFPPPGGGAVLLEILGMLERFDLSAAGAGSSAAAHLMVEAERRAYADRARWLGDPDRVPIPITGLLDAGYLTRRAAEIRADRATPSAEVAAGSPTPSEGQDTLHLSIGDEQGAVVALTTTLNANYGSGIVARETGILLNNEMDDFALAPGVPNLYGLVGGAANAVAGGKRPLSSMCPTVVERAEPGPRPFLVLGSPGGPTIITTVLQVLVNVLDHEMPLQEAVNASRFHHQWQPDRIRHEPRAFPADVIEALARRGHQLELAGEPLGNVAAIGLDDQGRWLGAPDPRGAGAARAF